MIIGVDIDQVIAGTDNFLRNLLEREFDRKFSREMVTMYDYEKCFVFNHKERDYFRKIFTCLKFWSVIPPFQGAKKILDFIARKNKIIIVTNRSQKFLKELPDITLEWLERHQIPFDDIIFGDNGTKYEAIRKKGYGITYFIEDNIEEALGLAKNGVKVLLLDYPWNQTKRNQNIIRVKNWQEIAKILEAKEWL